MSSKQSASSAADLGPSPYDLDVSCAVPRPLRLRTIQTLALSLAAFSIAAALEWPQHWPLVTLGDLAAISVLCALAAGREWSLRSWRHLSLATTRVAAAAQTTRRSDGSRFRAVLSQPRLRHRYAAAALLTFLAVSAATLMQRFAELNRGPAVQSVELSHPRDDG